MRRHCTILESGKWGLGLGIWKAWLKRANFFCRTAQVVRRRINRVTAGQLALPLSSERASDNKWREEGMKGSGDRQMLLVRDLCFGASSLTLNKEEGKKKLPRDFTLSGFGPSLPGKHKNLPPKKTLCEEGEKEGGGTALIQT